MEPIKMIRLLNEVAWLHHFEIRKIATDNQIYFGQPPVLEYLKKNGPCSQKEIAKELMVSPPSIAVSLRRMEKIGYVKKENSEKDLRTNFVSLTEKGRQVCEKCRHEFDLVDKKMFSTFSEQEQEEFIRLLTKLRNNFSEKQIEEIYLARRRSHK